MLKSVIVSAGIACAACGVSAATVTVDYQESSVFGTPKLAQNVRITSDKYTGYAGAGLFRLTADGYGDFNAFCVDLAQYINNGDTYETSVNLFSGATLENIDKLFTSAFAAVDTAVEAAAFRKYTLDFLESGTSQDVVTGALNPNSPLNGGGTIAPVPLPASGVLLLAGLAGAAGLGARKRKA